MTLQNIFFFLSLSRFPEFSPEFQPGFLPGYLGTPGCILVMSDTSDSYNTLPEHCFFRPYWVLL